MYIIILYDREWSVIKRHDFAKDGFKEIVIELEDEQTLFAFINGECGWLMYFRYEGDSGFSSRNPDFSGADSAIEFLLSNGQMDHYPVSWTLPVEQINKAINYFERERKQPPFITWHED